MMANDIRGDIVMIGGGEREMKAPYPMYPPPGMMYAPPFVPRMGTAAGRGAKEGGGERGVPSSFGFPPYYMPYAGQQAGDVYQGHDPEKQNRNDNMDMKTAEDLEVAENNCDSEPDTPSKSKPA
eukprot:594728_1